MGFTRLGLIANPDRAPRTRPERRLQRLGGLACGSLLIGLGVALYLHARLGLTPYDVFLSAITRAIGVSHGQAGWITAATLFAIAGFLGRWPAVPSVALIVANGFTTDLFNAVLPDMTSMPVRVLAILLGLAAMVGGISLVVHTNTTGGPFELLMNVASDRGRSPTSVRTVLEIGFLVLGIVCGGRIGLATLLYGLTVGPSIRWTLGALARRSVRSGAVDGSGIGSIGDRLMHQAPDLGGGHPSVTDGSNGAVLPAVADVELTAHHLEDASGDIAGGAREPGHQR